MVVKHAAHGLGDRYGDVKSRSQQGGGSSAGPDVVDADYEVVDDDKK